jgi:DNA polymerase III subunit delta
VPQISPDELQELLRGAPQGGAYFLHGTDEFQREEAVASLVAAHLSAGTRDFNLDQLRGADATPEGLASMLATPPMMAEWRVVVVREVQQLAPKAREVVEAAVRSLPDELVLVLAGTIPSGSQARFYGTLKSATRSAEFSPLDPSDAPGWLTHRANSVHGLELEHEAARALAAAVGTDLGILTSELAKLASFVGDRGRAGTDDVREVCGSIPRVDRWGWFDLVGSRRFDEAAHDLRDLLHSGESGVGLVIGLGTHLLRLAIIQSGGTPALERELKPFQRWLGRKLAPQARLWSATQLDEALRDLLRADRLLKSAPLSDRHVLEELLLRFRAKTFEVGAPG